MQFIVIFVALFAAVAARPQSNVASQETLASGGLGSTVVGTGSATAGNVVPGIGALGTGVVPGVIVPPVVVPQEVPVVPEVSGLGSNVASQHTTALGGEGSTIVADGTAQAGSVVG